MRSRQLEFNYQLRQKQSLICLGLFLCLTSSVEAVESRRLNFSQESSSTDSLESFQHQKRLPMALPASNSIQVAQKFCPSGLSVYVSAITANFKVYICGSRGNPLAFVAVPRDNSNVTTLKIQSANNNQYIAVNGNISYVLNQQELIIFRDGQPIVQERIERRKG